MLQVVAKSVKWGSIPALLIASLFSRYAASGEHVVDLTVCLGAIVLCCRAVWLRKYCWGAGFVAVVVVFSPLFLIVKILLLMAFTCVAALGALVMALRPRRAAAL